MNFSWSSPNDDLKIVFYVIFYADFDFEHQKYKFLTFMDDFWKIVVFAPCSDTLSQVFGHQPSRYNSGTCFGSPGILSHFNYTKPSWTLWIYCLLPCQKLQKPAFCQQCWWPPPVSPLRGSLRCPKCDAFCRTGGGFIRTNLGFFVPCGLGFEPHENCSRSFSSCPLLP